MSVSMQHCINSPAAQDKRPLGLYLHIPFCVRKCLYCDFLSMPADDDTIARYVEALCGQIRAEGTAYGAYRVNTVFLGGGTPSLLSGQQLTRILNTVFEVFDVEKEAEITMESNPGTLTAEKLAAYRAAGVNRLSIGLQSTEDGLLRSLGRIHTWQQFLDNFRAARAAGFTNINIDLMSALPGQRVEDWMETLRKAADLEPEHISAYSLIIEEGTPFYERYGEEGGGVAAARNGSPEAESAAVQGGAASESGCTVAALPWPPLPDEDAEREMYALTEKYLQTRGYHRYEISNYAREGRECRHNVGNWNRVEYLGLGIGAASLVENKRFRVIDDLARYLELMEGQKAAGGASSSSERLAGLLEPAPASEPSGALWPLLHEPVQILSVPEQMEEFMFLGLRLAAGVSTAHFAEQFGQDIRTVYGRTLDDLEGQELISFSKDRQQISLTERGVDISNYVLARFLLEE